MIFGVVVDLGINPTVVVASEQPKAVFWAKGVVAAVVHPQTLLQAAVVNFDFIRKHRPGEYACVQQVLVGELYHAVLGHRERPIGQRWVDPVVAELGV